MANVLQEVLDQDSVLRAQWLPVEEAARQIVDFESRFGETCLELACHAALPLVVNAGMVHLIRQNFFAHTPLPWIAEADLLLSPLCRTIGGEFYQCEPRIRECLLVDLEDRYGAGRIVMLAEWLLAYGNSPLAKSHPPDIVKTHRWVALAYTYPDQLIQEMTQELQATNQEPDTSSMDIAGHIHIASTMEMIGDVVEQRLKTDPAAFRDLKQSAKLMAYYWYGDRETLTRQAQEASLSTGELEQGESSQLSILIDWMKGKRSEPKETESPKATPPYQLPPAVEYALSETAAPFEEDEWVAPLVEEWTARIQEEHPAVVILKGTPGGNRTKVVRALAETLAPQFLDGLVYVDARDHRDDPGFQEALLIVILQAFAPEASVPSALDQLVWEYENTLQGKKTLTVVDYTEEFTLEVYGSEMTGPQANERSSTKSQYGKSQYGKAKYASEDDEEAQEFFKYLEPPPGNVLVLVGDQIRSEISQFLVLNLDEAVNRVSPPSDQTQTYDIYISYAHIDNQPLFGETGWVDYLHRSLQIRLEQLLGRRVKIWRDSMGERNRIFAETLINLIHETPIFLTILSPAYLQSEWCKLELQTFLDVALLEGAGRVGDYARICKVIKIPVPRDTYPEPLQKLLGYEFFEIDMKTNRHREFSQDRRSDSSLKYWAKLDDLAQDIANLLKMIGDEKGLKGSMISRNVKETKGQAPEGMVLIPKGPFLYGDEKKTVVIDHDYYMDIHPVTNAAFGKFIQAGGYEKKTFWSQDGWNWRKKEQIQLPKEWENEQFNQPDQPVVGVSNYEAEAYSNWAGKRLPTEEEWEKAARGTDGRKNPWGEEFDDGRCMSSVKKQRKRTAPIGSYFGGQSPYGCQDMAGNVWEWCASWYEKNKETRVLRGGSWDYDLPDNFRCAFRNFNDPRNRKYSIGFRCAQDAP